MTTPSIEAMVVKYTRLIHPQDLGEETSKLENILRQALIESTNAGKDEAVALLKEKRNGHCGKKDCLQAYCYNRKIIREFCDDTIKALTSK